MPFLPIRWGLFKVVSTKRSYGALRARETIMAYLTCSLSDLSPKRYHGASHGRETTGALSLCLFKVVFRETVIGNPHARKLVSTLSDLPPTQILRYGHKEGATVVRC